MLLSERNILLIITGGIAAYKMPLLMRELTKQRARIKVVLSHSASQFVGIETVRALSHNEVYQDLFDQHHDSMMHIDLARWADLILVAPATAHCIAQMAHGLASDLATTILLAAQVPIAVAPAMNQAMWANIVTQQNIEILRQRNILLWGPATGDQACGETGLGRMLEVDELLMQIQSFFQPQNYWYGRKILITAGPTQEALDPVRYLTNHSSGKMGYALAEAAAVYGAQVTLISGPTTLAISNTITRIQVTSAQEMYEQVLKNISDIDVFIGAAAVMDYRPQHYHTQKIKKGVTHLNLELVANPDIINEVAHLPKKPFVVGFAAETQQLFENAYAKLQRKNLDVIVANYVGAGRGFASDYNEMVIINRDGQQQAFSLQNKAQLAFKLLSVIAECRLVL